MSMSTIDIDIWLCVGCICACGYNHSCNIYNKLFLTVQCPTTIDSLWWNNSNQTAVLKMAKYPNDIFVYNQHLENYYLSNPSIYIALINVVPIYVVKFFVPSNINLRRLLIYVASCLELFKFLVKNILLFSMSNIKFVACLFNLCCLVLL